MELVVEGVEKIDGLSIQSAKLNDVAWNDVTILVLFESDEGGRPVDSGRRRGALEFAYDYVRDTEGAGMG